MYVCYFEHNVSKYFIFLCVCVCVFQNGWIGLVFPFSSISDFLSELRRPLIKDNQTTLKIQQFSCFNIQQWNSLQPHGDSFFFLSFIKRILSLAFNKVLLFIMFIDHPEIIRASRTMILCGSCSSYQGHVQRIPALSLTESLRIRCYSNIAVPKPLEPSNYCWVINTADCSSSWTP